MNSFPEIAKINFDEVVQNKIINEKTLLKWIAAWRLKNKKIVFTNGCFDLLHRGHLHLLNTARSLGDVLIVGLNTDASVNLIKPGRPVQDEQSRSLLMASLEVVDAVILFSEETPEQLINRILPDVLVKGADYKLNEVAGRAAVELNGGKVEIVPLRQGYSTSSLIEKLKS
jgi:D-beta-D-heptose 7-phosphate kinase/D-beta-D-heptose 1-phosphate adenosyltransferase